MRDSRSRRAACTSGKFAVGLAAWMVAVVVFGGRPTVGAAEPTNPHADDANKERVKILLIGHQPDHPPGTHLYLEECELLAQCLRQSPQVEAVVSDGWPPEAAQLAGVDAIVLYSSPGADLLLTGEHAETVQKMLKEGVGLVALHWATGVQGQEETELGARYLRELGGLFCFAFSGLDTSESKVEQLQADHPVCRGWQNFVLTDEFYLDVRILPEAKPLLKVSVKGRDHVVAWAYERPDSRGGRSYGNVLGHFHELFEREPFRRMLVNGILWAARYKVPEQGAPCALPAPEVKAK